MKIQRLLYFICGAIPFLWLVNFLLILILGAIKTGAIPKYGNVLDPNALGLDSLSFPLILLDMCGIWSVFIFPIITIILLSEKNYRKNYGLLPLILFLTGVVGFFLFRFCFTSQFDWVLD